MNQPQLDVTASIVLYQNNSEVVRKTVESFLKTNLRKTLYLIDNSPTDNLRSLRLSNTSVIEYIKNDKNIGFGKAHNIAFDLSLKMNAKYHVVLNPDVYFNEGTIELLFNYAEANPEVGLLSPKILYPDGSLQPLCKLLPTPADLFIRRFLSSTRISDQKTKIYELHDSKYDKIMNIPYLSGCFMFLRNSVLREIGYFDDRIFMYIEDADLTRRIYQKYKTLYFPQATIWHGYQKGSYKNLKLMLYNIHGAFVYFTKWGWFFDKQRREINKDVKKNYLKPS